MNDNFEIIEIADADLDALFEKSPELKEIVGIPVYHSKKYGLWPKPE